MMRRRLIPPAVSTVVLVVAGLPLVGEWVPEDAADRWTLFLTVAVFAFLALMFAWMRYRMIHDKPRLTVFGQSLVDFFSALTVLAFVLATVFSVSYVLAVRGVFPTPLWVRTANRAAIAFAGALVASTGIAVAYEMKRAGPVLAVHADGEAWDGTDRRIGPKDRRTGAIQ